MESSRVARLLEAAAITGLLHPMVDDTVLRGW